MAPKTILRPQRARRADWLSLLAAAPVEPLRVGGIITLVTAILAVQTVEAELLPYAPPLPSAPTDDPVLARVGDASLRVSDLRAQAGTPGASADQLVRQGYLDDAAQQLALAQAAEADGLADALEVRAALALARRRVLSEAYLDLAVSRAVTAEAVRAAYEREVAETRAHDRVAVRHVLTATREGAAEARRRAERGERLAKLAERLSQDEASRARGGSLGMVHPDALPESLAEAVAAAPIGTLVGPVRSEAGWHVARVEARRQMAVPPFEARAPALREALRTEAMRTAAARAQGALRTERLAPPAVTADASAP